jgi:hypothetical protein
MANIVHDNSLLFIEKDCVSEFMDKSASMGAAQIQ